jgi:phosphatidylglycerophosphatase C
VFDCDGTLIEGDVLKSFILELLGHGPRLGAALITLPVIGPLVLPHRTRRFAISSWLWMATVGRGDAEIDDRMDSYVTEHLGPGLSSLISAGVTALRRHTDQGDRVVIATAAAEPLARRLLERAGLGDVSLVASGIGSRARGWTLTSHCWGPFKPDLLRAAGFEPPYGAVYTDSFVDVPVLRDGVRAVLVNSADRIARRVRKRIPDLVTADWD